MNSFRSRKGHELPFIERVRSFPREHDGIERSHSIEHDKAFHRAERIRTRIDLTYERFEIILPS